MVVDPNTGLHKVMANMPYIWRRVTPHATEYLREMDGVPVVAVALYTSDGGGITYHDVDSDGGAPQEIILLAGASIVGRFLRVLPATEAQEVWAAFM